VIHLGIDFGTANTRVSKLENDVVPKVLRIGRGQNASEMMPSACWIDGRGKIVVGESCLARPNRIMFIKRYWQQRPEDRLAQIWPNGQKVVSDRTYSCGEVVEAVLSEAITRALEHLTPSEREEGFTANIVCPVDFDHKKRFSLVQMLSGQGARSLLPARRESTCQTGHPCVRRRCRHSRCRYRPL
jgi:molecular chaperone DnaK (HSP70)